MILADKIIALRKQNNWSQEQLAQELGVSRQSVGKWESGMSIPELDKIMKLSALFGVSTDYLLKDELETATPSEAIDADEAELLTVDMDEANSYMGLIAHAAPIFATVISAFILSPIPLLLLGALSEYRQLMNEDIAGALGISILMVVIVIGVIPLVFLGMQMNKYEYLQKEIFVLQYGVKGLVEKKKEACESTHRLSVTIGVALCIAGVIPLLLFGAGSGDDFISVCMTCVLLVFVSAGVHFFVRSGMIWDSYETLLQEGDYAPNEKRANKKLAAIPGAYWTLTTAIYLLWSFRTMAWHETWIVWPVAGVLFAAIMLIMKATVQRKDF